MIDLLEAELKILKKQKIRGELMENVMVVGAGFMGSGIAQVCAQTGYRVYLMDVNEEALNKALAGIIWSLEKFSSKGM